MVACHVSSLRWQSSTIPKTDNYGTHRQFHIHLHNYYGKSGINSGSYMCETSFSTRTFRPQLTLNLIPEVSTRASADKVTSKYDTLPLPKSRPLLAGSCRSATRRSVSGIRDSSKSRLKTSLAISRRGHQPLSVSSERCTGSNCLPTYSPVPDLVCGWGEYQRCT